MLFIKKLTLPLFLMMLAVAISCNQKNNKDVEPVKPVPIPFSVNDSVQVSIDKSPMDMSYFPADYPMQKMMNPGQGNLVARIIYSRPQIKGRTIFADSIGNQNVIHQYGKEWRLGANEATEIEFFKDVSIAGKPVAKGRYILYCVPGHENWKMIINSNLFSWGLHIDTTKNIAQFEFPVNLLNREIEYFTMVFEKAAYGCDLVMSWGNMQVKMPVNFSP